MKSTSLLISLVLFISICISTHVNCAWNLPPLGSPRILFADSSYLTKLKSDMAKPTNYATSFKNFVNSGISGGGSVYLFEAWHSALLFMVTGQVSYCNYAVQNIDSIVAQEESIIASGNIPSIAGDSYLDVGYGLHNIMTVYDWCRAQTSQSQRNRWTNYANQAVSNIWNCSTATWGGKDAAWSCWSVDNPGNNYYYSFLRATMMVGLATYGENASADMWLRQFRNVKIGNQLIPYFNGELKTGGSLEGTGYGISHKELFNLYIWWQLSTGENIADLTSHTYNSLQWILHQMVPQLDALANIGDQARDSSASFYDYHRHYIIALCYLYPKSKLAKSAKILLSKSSVPQMTSGFNTYIDYIYDISSIETVPLNSTYITTSFRGDSTGTLALRSSWDSDAVYANLVCGPLVESHAHQDQGSFILYHKGWLAYDQNFNSHSGIQQMNHYHNLVRIVSDNEIILQSGGSPCNMSALSDNSVYSYALSLVTPLYDSNNYNSKGLVTKVEREFVFIKPSTFVVFDRVATKTNSKAKRILSLNFMDKPSYSNGNLVFNSKSSITVKTLSPTSNLNVSIIDWKTEDSDNNAGYRVDYLDTSSLDSTNFLQVISINSSVASSIRDDVSGKIGATISLNDGRKVTVRFNTASTGGSIVVISNKQTTLVNEDLTTSKQALGVGEVIVPLSSPKPVPISSVQPGQKSSKAFTSTRVNSSRPSQMSSLFFIIVIIGFILIN
ncbi:predicted protein [Naegleria gruberi]|uniref:Predicted protein n=1 Tax=Naegleria gruberi TaxID=5762 RepID=D2VT24_NAEGR|nr:uncharacterized protein NAEGRDRAFT_72148 [Naegleria gruberi]EFC40010.1 predicted protein [Naegleria gruberi]|eukprot:XP_002672754.1 predicted protein [Naegleria gruberi strain NEG-M]